MNKIDLRNLLNLRIACCAWINSLSTIERKDNKDSVEEVRKDISIFLSSSLDIIERSFVFQYVNHNEDFKIFIKDSGTEEGEKSQKGYLESFFDAEKFFEVSEIIDTTIMSMAYNSKYAMMLAEDLQDVLKSLGMSNLYYSIKIAFKKMAELVKYWKMSVREIKEDLVEIDEELAKEITFVGEDKDNSIYIRKILDSGISIFADEKSVLFTSQKNRRMFLFREDSKNIEEMYRTLRKNNLIKDDYEWLKFPLNFKEKNFFNSLKKEGHLIGVDVEFTKNYVINIYGSDVVETPFRDLNSAVGYAFNKSKMISKQQESRRR